MIRYFEKMGVISPANRSPSGYRLFGQEHAKELRFVAEMQSLGFYADQIKTLRMIRDGDQPLAEKREAITALFEKHREYVEERARRFADLQAKLQASVPGFVEQILKSDC